VISTQVAVGISSLYCFPSSGYGGIRTQEFVVPCQKYGFPSVGLVVGGLNEQVVSSKTQAVKFEAFGIDAQASFAACCSAAFSSGVMFDYLLFTDFNSPLY
jgi:hypothetical protein